MDIQIHAGYRIELFLCVVDKDQRLRAHLQNKDENGANNFDMSDRNLEGKLDNNTERVASDRLTFLHF